MVGNKMEWKIGDRFIICGDKETLDDYSLFSYKNTIRTVKRITPIDLLFENPYGVKEDWNCPISCARKLTKLDKAMQ